MNPPTDLELASLEDLEREFFKRVDAAIIVYQKMEKTEAAGFHMAHSYKGGLPVAIGLAQLFVGMGPDILRGRDDGEGDNGGSK